jgi:peptidoglycan/LPS O-acetylase OafA/YrhL
LGQCRALCCSATGASICSPAAYEPIKLLRNGLLLDAEIVGVMWTLRIEMLAIPLFILGFFLLRRFGNVALVIPLAILLALATWRVWTGPIDPTLGLALLPFFAVGSLVFGVEKSPGRGFLPAWRRPSSSSPSP